jgi:preprotein translocase subunit SecG
MQEVVIAIHLMLAIGIVILVLLQRSEGGALGIGGTNSFMTGREAANMLTRTTAVLAAAFMATSIFLAILAKPQSSTSILDRTNKAAPAKAGDGSKNTGTTKANQKTGKKKPAVPVAD